VIAEVDVARDEDLNTDVAVAVGTKWECSQGAEQLDLAHLIRGQMSSSHDNDVARVNRIG
jgi:hypothetical protein